MNKSEIIDNINRNIQMLEELIDENLIEYAKTTDEIYAQTIELRIQFFRGKIAGYKMAIAFMK